MFQCGFVIKTQIGSKCFLKLVLKLPNRTKKPICLILHMNNRGFYKFKEVTERVSNW